MYNRIFTGTHLDLQGISVKYLATSFLIKVHNYGLNKPSKIYEMENLSDLDHDGLICTKGTNNVCPVDGKVGVAYVHSINVPNL